MSGNESERPQINTPQAEDKVSVADDDVNQFGETVSCRTSLSDTKRSSEETVQKLPNTGRYEIHSVLGRGGFGAVYLGYDKQLDRQVAIKVPLHAISKELEEKFLHEARQLAQLSHPNIVTVHDVGVDDGVCFIVSEFLDGDHLNLWLRERALTWREAVEIAAMLADALALAHSRNTVHRDVKPANIIMTERGDNFVPVLVDFGLALSDTNIETESGQRGLIAGTPNYMAPEQARGEGHRIDGRTDIYALGVILYRMLSGQLPFSAKSRSELLQSVIEDEPRPPRQFVRGIPRELERICLKAMAKRIPDRYTTAADLAEDLRNLLHQQENQVRTAAKSPTKNQTMFREATRILIADDHELSRFKLENDLKKWGHDVTTAEDGEQAWEFFQKNQYSIVITDWMMPKLDGLELVRMIRSAKRENYVYVIMLTAKAEKHDIVAGMGAGADDFLAKPFHRDELQVRVRAGVRITDLNRKLNETNRRLQNSQEAASQMQQSFLPSAKPQYDGFEFAWTHEACGELGGDMFNVVQLDEEHVGIWVLDVTGEGIPAALLATTLSRVMSPAADPASLLVQRSDSGSDYRILEPVDVARELNRRFGIQEGKQFFTFAYGVLDLNTREFQFTCAGHPPLLWHQAGTSAIMLDVEGVPIGMMPDCDEFNQKSVTLKPGDRLLIYSDGLPDAMNPDGEVFGAARLLESVNRLRDESLDELILSLNGQLKDWQGNAASKSDVSVIAFEVS